MDYTNLSMMKEKNTEMIEKLTSFIGGDEKNLTEEQTFKIEAYKNYMESIIAKIEKDYNLMLEGDKSEELRNRFNENYFKIKKPHDLINASTGEKTEENLKKIESFLETTQMYLRINQIEEQINKFTTFEELKRDVNRGSFFPLNDEQLMKAFESDFLSIRKAMPNDEKNIAKLDDLEAKLTTMYQVHNKEEVTENLEEKIDIVLPESKDIYEILDLPRDCTADELTEKYTDLKDQYTMMMNNPEKYNNTHVVPEFVKTVLKPGYQEAMKSKSGPVSSDEAAHDDSENETQKEKTIDEFVEEVSKNVQKTIEKEDAENNTLKGEDSEKIVGLVPYDENVKKAFPDVEPKSSDKPVGLVPYVERKDIKTPEPKPIIVKKKDVNKWKKAIIFATGAILAGSANIATANASAPIINALAYTGLASGTIVKLIKKFKKNKAVAVEEPTKEQQEEANAIMQKVQNYLKSDEFIEDMMTFSSGMLLGSKLTSIASNLVSADAVTPDVAEVTPEIGEVTPEIVSPEIPVSTPEIPDVDLYDKLVVGEGIDGTSFAEGFKDSYSAVLDNNSLSLNQGIIYDGETILEKIVYITEEGLVDVSNYTSEQLANLDISKVACHFSDSSGNPRFWAQGEEVMTQLGNVVSTGRTM